eukprot:3626372-Rhodomonas_salina.2
MRLSLTDLSESHERVRTDLGQRRSLILQYRTRGIGTPSLPPSHPVTPVPGYHGYRDSGTNADHRRKLANTEGRKVCSKTPIFCALDIKLHPQFAISALRNPSAQAMRRSVQLQDKKEEMRRQNAEDQKHPLVDACAELLKTTVEDNDAAMRTSMPVMRVFDGDRVCPVAVDNYVRRIMKYGSCDPACLAMAMIYLERIKKKWQKTWITSQNVQRLYLVAVMEAAKFHEDCTYTNARWAEIGAISLEEINKLEIAFLSLTEWELFVDRVDYD